MVVVGGYLAADLLVYRSGVEKLVDVEYDMLVDDVVDAGVDRRVARMAVDVG